MPSPLMSPTSDGAAERGDGRPEDRHLLAELGQQDGREIEIPGDGEIDAAGEDHQRLPAGDDPQVGGQHELLRSDSSTETNPGARIAAAARRIRISP